MPRKRLSEASLRLKQAFHPESLMMTYAYKPELSEGALKAPIADLAQALQQV